MAPISPGEDGEVSAREETLARGDVKELVTVWYNFYNPGPEVTSRAKGN